MEPYSNLGYCGVDCFSCPDYLNKVCPSCRGTDWKDDPGMPVKCCRDRGIGLCAFCAGFPCESMAGFYAESDGHRAAYDRMLSLRQTGGKE